MVSKTDLKSGFTLIELIVVMAILSVLAALAALFVPALIEKARMATDRQNIAVLNTATQHYLFNAPSPNPFEVVSETNDSRIGKLMDSGYLSEPVVPQQKGKVFEWNLLDKTWQMANGSPDAEQLIVNPPSEDTGSSTEPPAETVPASDYGLGLDGKSSFITTFTGSGTVIEIPGTINGVTVTGIAAGVFQGKGLTEITLPESVKTIEPRAFINNSITKITIGSGVSIDKNAFNGGSIDKFVDFYTSKSVNKAGGTYEWIDNKWVKK